MEQTKLTLNNFRYNFKGNCIFLLPISLYNIKGEEQEGEDLKYISKKYIEFKFSLQRFVYMDLDKYRYKIKFILEEYLNNLKSDMFIYNFDIEHIIRLNEEFFNVKVMILLPYDSNNNDIYFRVSIR